jgi:hypothetical protein
MAITIAGNTPGNPTTNPSQGWVENDEMAASWDCPTLPQHWPFRALQSIIHSFIHYIL